MIRKTAVCNQDIVFKYRREMCFSPRNATKPLVCKSEDIISYELLTELPKISRTAGTGLENVAKGIFSVKGIDTNCRLCLYPKAELFLLLETEEQTYLFGMENTEQMQKIYNTLLQ